MKSIDISQIDSMLGAELGVSKWHAITQDQITDFANLTGDTQWIHMDAERSKVESPFGVPVAHGYFVLSLISKFFGEVVAFEPVQMALNYGLNKVRFTNAVKVNSQVRARISLKECIGIERGARLYFDVVIEIKDEEKPACVAETIAQLYF
jgi:acyl dehydratase